MPRGSSLSSRSAGSTLQEYRLLPESKKQPSRHCTPALWMLGGGLVGLHLGLTALSRRFDYNLPALDQPVLWLTALLVIAAGIYLFALWWLDPQRELSRSYGWWIMVLLVGLLMRLSMFGSTPMLETDHYRYLWDGAVTASGKNPYAYSPETIKEQPEDAPSAWLGNVQAAGNTIERINHPHLRTIYPPLAQAAFALAYFIKPWSVDGLRAVWLLADILALGILALLLRQLALPTTLLLIYWWNPLFIKEAYNSAHMDVLLMPCLAGGLYWLARHRLAGAGGLFSAAAGIKVWPLLLTLIPVRQAWPDSRRSLVILLAAWLPAALLISPLLVTVLDSGSGFGAYASYWRMNDSIYLLIHELAANITEHPYLLARLTTVALVGGWAILLCRQPGPDPHATCRRALWLTAAIFLLSPTQFPWYWLWLLPMLVIHPSPGLLILTLTLPLYYLRFHLAALGHAAWFDYGIVWLEFAPAWGLLTWEAWRRRFANPGAPPFSVTDDR